MAKRVTIKDIAGKAGVSIGTVHCALAGKPGVSEDTRRRIADIAQLYGYRPNSVAASLKRKTIRIAAALPGPTNENRFYFTYVWEGIRDYLDSMRDYNIEVAEYPYYNDAKGQTAEVEKVLGRSDIDGVLTIGYMNAGCRTVLQRLNGNGVPFVLVGSDLPESGRLCCVQPNYDVVGRTLAELLQWQAPEGDILVCAGDIMTPSHYQIVLGLEAYCKERSLRRRILKIHDTGGDIRLDLENTLLGHPEITACCCVNARGSVMLGQALESSGRAGTMPAIGCDVFEENIAFLEKGTFTNLLHKNPYSQAYMGAKYLIDFLLGGDKPPQDIIPVGSEILFQSSLPMIRTGQRTLYAVIS